MRAKAVVWLGTRTNRFDEMRDFLRRLTGEEPRIDEEAFAVFDLRGGDRLEIFGVRAHVTARASGALDLKSSSRA